MGAWIETNKQVKGVANHHPLHEEKTEEKKEMKSEWRATCNYIGGEQFYGVYRLRNRKEVDHSGNRETPDKQFFDAIENLLGRKLNPQDRAEAEKIAQLLNAAPKE